MLLSSNEIFFSARNPANASLFIIGKTFFDSDSCSTVIGMFFNGISVNPPELHITWKIEQFFDLLKNDLICNRIIGFLG